MVWEMDGLGDGWFGRWMVWEMESGEGVGFLCILYRCFEFVVDRDDVYHRHDFEWWTSLVPRVL
jgi:hypothetical protein